MKIRFFYKDISQHMKTNDPEISTIGFKTKLLDSSAHVKKSYETYLLCALDFDLFENKRGQCDELLKIIEKIERGLKKKHVYHGQGFDHYLYKHSVIFEHAIFGVCPHWPQWSCPLSHYKIAIQGMRDFFLLPESLDTELIVELPISNMAEVTLFPVPDYKRFVVY
jgi:hypothetical protein